MSATTEISSTTLVRKLFTEWEAVHATTVRIYDGLGDYSGADLLQTIRTTRDTAQDTQLHQLLTLTRNGDRHAERVLLQYLLPHAILLARSTRALFQLAPVDRIGVAITASWEVIRTYPLHRTSRVSSNLKLEALRCVSPRRPAGDEIPTADDKLDTMAAMHPEYPSDTPEARVIELFTWARDTGVLSRDEIMLLARVELGDETRKDIANAMGIGYETLKKRATRIRAKLAASIRDYTA